MKVLFEYDQLTGNITDANGMTSNVIGMVPFTSDKNPEIILELVKQGLTTDKILKLKDADLL